MRARDVVIGLGLAAGAAAVAVWSGSEAGREADRRAFASINSSADPGIDRGTDLLFLQITELGSIAASTGAAAVLAVSGRPREAARAICAAGFTWLACQGVKRMTDRPRPYDALPEQVRLLIAKPKATSFPSSHPAVLTTFHRVAARDIGLGPTSRAVLSATDGTVGVSRVALGVHWPSDVAGGLLLGRAIARLWPRGRR